MKAKLILAIALIVIALLLVVVFLGGFFSGEQTITIDINESRTLRYEGWDFTFTYLGPYDFNGTKYGIVKITDPHGSYFDFAIPNDGSWSTYWSGYSSAYDNWDINLEIKIVKQTSDSITFVIREDKSQ
jgi:hypothetical protein